MSNHRPVKWGALIEQTFKQRALAALRRMNGDYSEWMITVTYGTD